MLLEEFVGKVAKGEEVEQWEFEEARGVVLAKEEAKSLKEWRDEFGRWGIEVGEGETGAEEVEGGEGGDYVQVWVKTVPRVVKERLWNDPRLLQELLRSFLAQLEADGGGATKRRPTSATWGSLGQCPAVLLDLINSKACRGAIMFNDGAYPHFKPPLAIVADWSLTCNRAHGEAVHYTSISTRTMLFPVPMRSWPTFDDPCCQPRRGEGRAVECSRCGRLELACGGRR